jgi:hypothetical protein
MAAGVLKAGAERVFLRVLEQSDAREAARSAGFFRYQSETLYRRDAKHWRPSGAELRLRPKGKADAFAIYQLYNRVTPANVRGIEGATFREWQAAQEKWGGRTTDLLLEEDGAVNGWLRVMPGHVGRIGAMTAGGPYDDLVGAGLDLLQDRDVYCLVPDYNSALASAVERYAFEPAASFISLAKRLTRPIEEPALETTSEAVPVG